MITAKPIKIGHKRFKMVLTKPIMEKFAKVVGVFGFGMAMDISGIANNTAVAATAAIFLLIIFLLNVTLNFPRPFIFLRESWIF